MDARSAYCRARSAAAGRCGRRARRPEPAARTRMRVIMADPRNEQGAAAAAIPPAEALALARRGEGAAALEAIERAIEAAPEGIEGYLAKGRIVRIAGGDHG